VGDNDSDGVKAGLWDPGDLWKRFRWNHIRIGGKIFCYVVEIESRGGTPSRRLVLLGGQWAACKWVNNKSTNTVFIDTLLLIYFILPRAPGTSPFPRPLPHLAFFFFYKTPDNNFFFLAQ
jgi:hypothetical protein